MYDIFLCLIKFWHKIFGIKIRKKIRTGKNANLKLYLDWNYLNQSPQQLIK